MVRVPELRKFWRDQWRGDNSFNNYYRLFFWTRQIVIRAMTREVFGWYPVALLVIFTIGVAFSVSLHGQDAQLSQDNAVRLGIMQSQLHDLADLGPQVNAIKMHAQETDSLIRELKDEMDAVYSVAKWIAFAVFGLVGHQAWKKIYPPPGEGSGTGIPTLGGSK